MTRTRLTIVLLTALIAGSAQAGLFGPSKETKTYKKYRDIARKAMADGDYQVAQTNFLTAHAALVKKGFKNMYFKESLVDLASFYTRGGKPYLSEPYLVTLRDYYVERRGTNHLDTGRAYYLIGQVQGHLYKFKEAEDSLKRAEHITRWKIGRYSVSAGYAKAMLGQLYVSMKRDEEAIQHLEAGLKQMGQHRTKTRYVREFGSYTRVERQSFYRPDPEDVVDVLIDYGVALTALGRSLEASEALKQAHEQLRAAYPNASTQYHVLREVARTFEARGDLPEAEQHYYKAAEALWGNDKLSKREKLLGHEMVLEFHVRQGQDSKAETQEAILFEAGVSEDYLHALNVRSEQLSYAREGGPHKKY